jgi:hypothetical protein
MNAESKTNEDKTYWVSEQFIGTLYTKFATIDLQISQLLYVRDGILNKIGLYCNVTFHSQQ